MYSINIIDKLSSFLVKVGNNEGSLMTGVKLPNLLGRGERLQVCKNNDPSYSQKISKVLRVEQYFPQADYTYGTKKSSNFNLSLLKPLRGKLRSSLTGNVYQVERVLFLQVFLYPPHFSPMQSTLPPDSSNWIVASWPILLLPPPHMFSTVFRCLLFFSRYIDLLLN